MHYLLHQISHLCIILIVVMEQKRILNVSAEISYYSYFMPVLNLK